MLKELSENFSEANAQAKKIAMKILASLDRPYPLGGHQHHCGASIGITLFGKNRESVDDLLKRADLAQYRAKSAVDAPSDFLIQKWKPRQERAPH